MLLKDRLKEYEVLLASKSPRRRQLLADCGIEFRVAEGRDAEECYPADMPLEEVAEYLSQLKSDAYADVLEGGQVLITADTVVIAGGEILGKPKDREDALRMLSLLSGAEHKVITGVTLRTRDRHRSFACESKVRFRALERPEMEYYIDTYHPYDKAGAYGIQEWIGYVGIEGIEGSFYNVMGLPIQRLYVELEDFLKY
ncbi:MAG: septum formation protein Maf [Tidjanibacter sp.]|nr:septum formation protein Maf [Tidjanibacter sp.]